MDTDPIAPVTKTPGPMGSEKELVTLVAEREADLPHGCGNGRSSRGESGPRACYARLPHRRRARTGTVRTARQDDEHPGHKGPRTMRVRARN